MVTPTAHMKIIPFLDSGCNIKTNVLFFFWPGEKKISGAIPTIFTLYPAWAAMPKRIVLEADVGEPACRGTLTA
jgi:hypothetical protein